MLMKATIPMAIQAEKAVNCEEMQRYCLMVVGDNKCGKTCLLNSFVKSDFEVNFIL